MFWQSLPERTLNSVPTGIGSKGVREKLLKEKEDMEP